MESQPLERENELAVKQVLGYLNFSAGAPDPTFLATIDQLWQWAAEAKADEPTWNTVGRRLQSELDDLEQRNPAFSDAGQAKNALSVLLDHVLPEYLEFHRDLLFHQDEELIFNAFFVGRCCEAVLQQSTGGGTLAEQAHRAIAQVNDFIGYRPVAVLESKKIEPYQYEWIRPVPLYIRDAGVATGVYHDVVELALSLLRETDEHLLAQACLDPAMLDELAFDPRAYDFDHPANKRPNYHFGLWDPHHIDNRGFYRRFVVQQITLDALMHRFEEPGNITREEILFEAAAVLAGTILMAAGVSGCGPDTHDSNTTLATLMPRIAAYRDAFYEQLLDRTEPGHAERLREEQRERRQPFGAARQHLNAQLARRRASQLEHVQLAKLFAKMGYASAAEEQAAVIPAASTRVICQTDCKMTAARQAINSGATEEAVSLLDEVIQLVRQGIDRGAIVDPWNILGFDAQFSLFPALENSIHDHRIDELVDLMEQLFDLHSRAWSEAAARDEGALCDRIAEQFRALATWWRQFASHEVSNIDAVDSVEAFHAAEHVARAINLWHRGGAATGDIGFWAGHADLFDSPKAYSLVIAALLDQSDYVASMGLLVHWISEVERVPLEQGESSFHRLAERWLLQVRKVENRCPSSNDDRLAVITFETWRGIRKLIDYLEANAEQYWQVPVFQLGEAERPQARDEPAAISPDGDEPEDEDDLFSAAYENVVFRDSADDGVEGPLFDTGYSDADGLIVESERISERLGFLITVSRLCKMAALTPVQCAEGEQDQQAERIAAMRRWSEHAESNRVQLTQLLDAVDRYQIPTPLGDHDSMVEYDRRRVVKESLLERIIETCVECADASRLLAAAEMASARQSNQAPPPPDSGDTESLEDSLTIETFAKVLSRDVETLSESVSDLIAVLSDCPLLYVPLAKGGNPLDIVRVRIRQKCIQDLQKCLPRLGLFVDACRLIETAREMERNNPVGPGAVTEFDEIFKIGYKAIVECLVAAAESWDDEHADGSSIDNAANSLLVARLEQLTEALLITWLAHSRTLRLSVLEKVNDKQAWNRIVSFIERYGEDLFTQRFLNLGNVRAILHQGTESWLAQIQQEFQDIQIRLFDELDGQISQQEAGESLTLILESIVENYGEYRDYNSTTTQSDRGDLLYTLLDFLRLRARYDRVCWNLKPVVLAHQILVRRGRKRAAQIWRRALRDRIRDEADKYEQKLATLQKKYAMQMPSIADRIGERFMRAMIIDRVCALVQPAVDEAAKDGPKPTFRMLQYETEFLTRDPSGVGFDIPAWLIALEDEVERARRPIWERVNCDELNAAVPITKLTHEQIESQLDEWSER